MHAYIHTCIQINKQTTQNNVCFVLLINTSKFQKP